MNKSELISRRESLFDLRDSGKDISRDFIILLADIYSYGESDILENEITLDNISPDYLENQLLWDMQESLSIQGNAQVYKKLGQREKAAELIEKAGFFTKAKWALGVMSHTPAISESNEFKEFAMNYHFTEFDTDAKPKLELV